MVKLTLKKNLLVIRLYLDNPHRYGRIFDK